MLDSVDTAWLAGLLEGEGYFCLVRLPKAKALNPRIRLGMTDKDVAITGWPAVDVMRAVRPHMGQRRGARIDEILASEFLEVSYRKAPIYKCRNGHDLQRYGRKPSGCCRECARLGQKKLRARRRKARA